jgi:hypothetical protein
MQKILIAIAGIAAIVFAWYLWPGGDVAVAPTVEPLVSTPLADDLVVLDAPLPGQVIASPLTVRGMARGFWFFEASFPVFLTDWDGRIIATGIATAQNEWMTEEFVPFEATLEFTVPSGPGEARNRGTLILQKDNPSGLPEHDDAREITIFFE